MGRLDEYDEADQAILRGRLADDERAAAQFWNNAQLGKRVRDMILNGRAGDDLNKLVADVVREAAGGC